MNAPDSITFFCRHCEKEVTGHRKRGALLSSTGICDTCQQVTTLPANKMVLYIILAVLVGFIQPALAGNLEFHEVLLLLSGCIVLVNEMTILIRYREAVAKASK
ncbi:MAG: hypothetical protein HQL50_09550 [Magnetococcales bacterium]|nr:hypothetical protein [Magnetococcales bacterium]